MTKYLPDNHGIILAIKNRLNSMSPFTDYYVPRHYYSDDYDGLDFNIDFSVDKIRMWINTYDKSYTGTVYILFNRVIVSNGETIETLKYLDDIPEEVITDFEETLLNAVHYWIPNIDFDFSISFYR
jgi:hypothetical protein